jgi:hypothetical protein
VGAATARLFIVVVEACETTGSPKQAQIHYCAGTVLHHMSTATRAPFVTVPTLCVCEAFLFRPPYSNILLKPCHLLSSVVWKV